MPSELNAWLSTSRKCERSGRPSEADGVVFAAGECLTLTGTVRLDADPAAKLLLAYPGERILS